MQSVTADFRKAARIRRQTRGLAKFLASLKHEGHRRERQFSRSLTRALVVGDDYAKSYRPITGWDVF